MSDPIKLTDEVIETIQRSLAFTDFTGQRTRSILAAIRALRDAARAVVDSVECLDETNPVRCIVSSGAIESIEALLPDGGKP